MKTNQNLVKTFSEISLKSLIHRFFNFSTKNSKFLNGILIKAHWDRVIHSFSEPTYASIRICDEPNMYKSSDLFEVAYGGSKRKYYF